MSNDTTPTETPGKPTDWRVATVVQIRTEGPALRTYSFQFDGPVHHDAGQHYEIRLTAPNGYQAARLYSAAAPADGSSNRLELTIALMPKGEVSSYLFNYVKPGSQLEIRGPLGRYFIWTPAVTRPVLLIGGGTGVVPLRAMRLQHQQAAEPSMLRLLYSVRTYPDMAYKYELFADGHPAADVVMSFTDEAPDGWAGYARRVDSDMLKELLATYAASPVVYVCGPTPMVEAVTSQLVSVGLDPNDIKAERFGSTG